MGLTTGALQLGKTALLSYQSALQVIGNNIANAGVDGYSRQTPLLTSLQGQPLPEGLLAGGGVGLTALQRHLDEALEAQLRSAGGDEQSANAQEQTLAGIESIYNELTDSDLSSQLGAFFNAFSAVQNTPQDTTVRGQAITTGQTLAQALQNLRSELMRMHDQLNTQIGDSVNQANDLAQQVADLNLQIVKAESTGQGAAASLRDQRDGVLKQLAGLMDIQTVETSDGAVNVYVGNEPLVDYTRSRGLKIDSEKTGDRTVASVHFADNDGTVKISSGQIAGQIIGRDEYVYGQVQQIDTLAANLINQVNRLHSQGQGLTDYTSITSGAVLDAGVALNSSAAGLSSSPTTGTFTLTVTEGSTGQPTQYEIPVTLPSSGTGTSLTDLANYIEANVDGLSASITADNRLQIDADANNTFAFGEDSGGVVAALGLNTFFTGTDATNIAVRSDLVGHPELLAASSNGQPGDGSNAGAIAALADDQNAPVGTLSIPAQWRAIVSTLATTSATAKNSNDAAHNVSESLKAQRESVSGVNTDEEAVHLMNYQRSFQATARYITIIDQLVNEMLQMVQ